MTDLKLTAIKAEWPTALNDPAVSVIHALCDALAEYENSIPEELETIND
jgi:hypothetical protein